MVVSRQFRLAMPNFQQSNSHLPSITTPNGSLIAYTLPANIKELRDQVALVSISWKEHLEARSNVDNSPQQTQDHGNNHEPSQRTVTPDALETLTIEFDKGNLIVRYLQPRLLLVLEGGVPPGRRRPLKVTAEAPGEAPYPSAERPESPPPPPSVTESENGGRSARGSPPKAAALSSSTGSKASTAISSNTGRKLSVLAVHRRKMDILARTIKDEFERSGFVMPDDPSNKFF